MERMKTRTTEKLFGLIGNPVSHSMSPIIQNYLFDKYNISAYYTTFCVNKNNLKEAIEGIKSLRFGGVNVTAPFKQEIIKYLDEIDGKSMSIGAINTIVNNGGKLYGYNTDYQGVLYTFKKNNINLSSKKAIIFGAGGVASTICHAFRDMNVKEIYVINRDVEKAEKLIKSIKKRRITLKYGELSTSTVNSLIKNVDIVVNATSIDLLSNEIIDIDFDILKQSIVFFDVLYTPIYTEILQKARKRGYKVINGIEMLIYQAIKSFEIWTGIQVEDDDCNHLKTLILNRINT